MISIFHYEYEYRVFDYINSQVTVFMLEEEPLTSILRIKIKQIHVIRGRMHLLVVHVIYTYSYINDRE